MLFRLFRLPPIVYFILSPILLVLGVVLYFYETDRDDQRAAALSHDAPAEIELADIPTSESGSDFNEIVVRAQLDFNNAMELVRTKRGRERGRKLFVPMHPADAADFSAPALAVMEIDGAVSDGELAQFYVADGAVGPVFVLNGVLEGGTGSDVAQAFEGRVTLAPDAPTVIPFVEGREAALQAKNMGMTLLILGLVLAALLGGYGYLRKRHLDAQRAAEEAQYAEG